MVDKIYNEYMVSTNIENGKIYYFLVYDSTIVNIENIFHQKVMVLHDSTRSCMCYDD
jgi:hypothetical protein